MSNINLLAAHTVFPSVICRLTMLQSRCEQSEVSVVSDRSVNYGD
jgi:hypothetical protein